MSNVSSQFDPSEFLARLDKLRANLPVALKAVAVAVLTRAQKTITDGNPDWAQRSRLPKTPHQLLWETGTLLRSLTIGGSGNVFEESDNSITVGSNVAYAQAQQEGFAPHNLPPRPFFVFDSDGDEQNRRIFEKYLFSGVIDNGSIT